MALEVATAMRTLTNVPKRHTLAPGAPNKVSFVLTMTHRNVTKAGVVQDTQLCFLMIRRSR
jgi:hypothetical protein